MMLVAPKRKRCVKPSFLGLGCEFSVGGGGGSGPGGHRKAQVCLPTKIEATRSRFLQDNGCWLLTHEV